MLTFTHTGEKSPGMRILGFEINVEGEHMQQVVPDHLQKGLSIIFVGFNPSLKSAETGHHYANPNNRFWKILYESGLTPRLYLPKEDGELLKLGYGLTNIVDRPTKAASELSKAEYQYGKIQLHNKIEYYRPRIVCFVGKGVFLEYSGKKSAPWGRQDLETIPGVIDFVAPSSSGLVRMKLDEVVSIYKELKRLVGS